MTDIAAERMRKRSVSDHVICSYNASRYAIVEPIMLRIARAKYANEYQQDTDNPLISVYTPTYNRGDILVERALKSILAQTYKNFEYIIIGDHCTDNTAKLLAKVDDPRVKFHNLSHRKAIYPDTIKNHWLVGPVRPANEALKLVTGKWIARLDDDDICTPDHLESLLRFAQAGNFEFVSGQLLEDRGDGKELLCGGGGPYEPYYTGKSTPPPPNVYNPGIGNPSTWLYRSYLKFFKYNRHCWRKKMNRVNDLDIVLRIFQAGTNMGFLEKVVLYKCPRPGEKITGWSAYANNEEAKTEHYKFQ